MNREMRAASLILCLGILLTTIQNGIAERKIICYYTNWSVYRPGTAKFSPQNINPYLCTHLIYAFGGFTKDNALKPFDKYQDIEKGGYAKFTGLKTYNKNLKTLLAIGGWNEGSSRFSPMVADPARRREFVKNAVKFLRQNHFDGLDLDWEYPAFRDGGKPRDKDNYANLVQELYEEFERESSKTGRPRLLLSMAMPAGIDYIDKGYDVPRLNEYLDFINLLSYDYHSAYEPAVNHHSPLYPLEEDNEYNYDAELTIDYTISHLLEKGASADKIILGIPTYGRSYTLFNEEATDLGSPADGPGVEGDATREKGYLAYYEICENIAESDKWEVVQPNPKAMGPYAFNGNQWVGYDDEDIVKLKARYVNEKKLGGIMFWSIDNDDFRGKCHGRPYPLIEAAKEALLTDNRNTIENTKSVDSRKKIRTQGIQNARKLGTNSQRSTTSAPITRRVSSSRPKYRHILKSKTSDADEEDREVSRRSYDPSSDEDTEGRNTVRVTEKIERPKNRNRSRTRNSSTDHSSRRKQSRRKEQNKTDEEEGSLSNKLTTPEPPTTPDPGSDFKCEDEGFFPHPRDCKKYFWCLDSGPSGLGVVAHQFTCPSGLVFNKAADSCDYPRNVICPKTSKTSVVSTTRLPITAATSRTTYLHSTTTAKIESEEYDSEEEDYEEDAIEESEEEEVREEPKVTTTTKPLVYKTLTRNRPSTTTTATTTKPNERERASDGEEEEDPRVIKELIDLIKKAGGIEHLEKQLLLQEKNSDIRSDSESVTPATISRSLYERVLSRQANKLGNSRPVSSSSETSYVNGPGRAQFEGLDDIPEVKSLRRSQKPQYVTIERSKSSVTTESPENEDIDENEEDDDNTDVASSEEESISNPLEGSSSTQRVTPNYVNIRRTRPSTTTSKIENDVDEKEVEEERPTRRRRPYVSKQQNNEAGFDTLKSFRSEGSGFRNSEKGDDSAGVNLSTEKNDASPTINSRYTNIQRFRGVASKSSENLSSVPSLEITTPLAKLEEYPEVQSSTTDSTITFSSTTPTTTTSTSTEVITVISVEPSENPFSVSSKVGNTSSTTDSMKLVEDSATEILFTTLPATTSSTTTTKTTTASRSTIATVSQPRPFGFTRRRFSSSEATTTTTTSGPSRSKVADSKPIRLPTLKELIGYPTTYYYDDHIATTPSALLHLLRNDVDNDISQQNVEEILFQKTNESRDGEREQTTRDTIEEETGNSWLRQASENKVRSRTPKRTDVTLEERPLITSIPIIQEDEDRQKKYSILMYLKPTTMRGIPLVSLTSSPVTRGFYVTRSEEDPPSSTLAIDFTSSYTTIDSFIERQTETALIPDISTTDETVTVTHNNQNKPGLDDNINDITDKIVTRNDQNELELNTFNNVNDTKNKGVDDEKFSTFDSLVISSENSDSAENPSTYTEPDTITISVSRPTSKRGKSLRNFDYNTTPLADVPTTSTRRKIAIAVSKYKEASIPLWTGRRIVTRKRNRTAVSSIKEAERRIDETSLHTAKSIFKSASATSEIPSTLTSAKRKLAAISTVPTIPLIVSESTISPEILDDYSDLVYSTDGSTVTEDPIDRTTAETTITVTNSIITATPPITKIASITNNSTVISTISNDFTSVTAMSSTANESIIMTTSSSTVTVAKAPTVASDQATITTKSAEIEIPVSMTTNYSIAAVPTTANMHAIANDSVITSTTTSSGVEITSPIANYSIDFANMIIPATLSDRIEITSTITNYSDIAIPINTSTNAIVTDSAVTTVPTIITGIETTSTVADSVVAIPTATNKQEIAIDSTITAATTSTEVETIITNNPAFVIPAATMNPVTTISIISSTNASISATTSNLTDADTVTVTDMLTTTIPTTIVIPTISNVITSANANVPSTFAITDTSTITSLPKTNSVILSKDSVTSTDETSLSSTVPTLTLESTTAHFNSNIFNISSDSEISAVTATPKFIQTTEIPTTLETSPIFTSTVDSRSLPSTNPAMLSTTAFSDQTSENSVTSMITQTPSTLFSIVTPVTNKATVEKSTLSATYDESIATNTMIQITGIYEPSSIQTTSKESMVTPKMKTASEEVASRTIQSRKQDQPSKPDDQVGQKTSRRRVVNRTNNWIGKPVVQQTVNQHPLHRVTQYRGRPRRPPGYTSRVVEENRRRRIVQRRMRVNFEPISSTIKPDDNIVQNITEDHVAYNRTGNVRKRMRIVSKRVKERVEQEETTTLQETTLLFQSSADNENKTHHEKVNRENGNVEKEREDIKEIKSQENLVTNKTSADLNLVNENLSSNFQSNLRMSNNLSEQENKRKRMRVVLKDIRPKSEKKNPIEEAREDADSVDKSFQGSFSTNFYANSNFSNKGRTGRRMRILLKSVRPTSIKNNSMIEETNADIIEKNLQNNLSTSKNFSDEKKTRRRMRIVLKRVRPKFEEEKAKTEENSVHSNSNEKNSNESLRGVFLNNLKNGTNFSVKYKDRRRMRVVLKSIKPKSEEKNSTTKETDSDSTDTDLQGSFSNNFHTNVNLFDKENSRKSIKSKFEEKDSIIEETRAHSDFIDKNFSSNLSDNFSNQEQILTHFKYGKKEATIERLENTEEPQTTETFVLVKDTDQPSLEVNSLKNSGSIGHKSGLSNRHRKPTQSTTTAPLINTFPSTVAIYRSGKPIETTFSSRIDLVDAFEDTRSAVVQNDQKTDVSDQSIRAQEFAVTLADPPQSSSPDTGRTVLRDAARRKISTTVAPRTDPTIDRTILRYNADFRNRQRSQTKSARPTVNTTTRPRRPPVLDYDYYEDETPIVIGNSFLNSKLFLTSKGTIRCLDQGNFPHPYSCKKFISCARMVNGQVIGTEYTCPDKLTFDPIGGICNWSAGLGCKD
ncbi:serine-rich adhesin for platelets-like [Cataglyphis hispanica]|uniref:serine-rich adhesin for platelets-like n=1 Tax=Cataglyphis hispanica TaxID=1086592 RepID=UPI00217F7AC9|nr:serine-rich adhesin for platelets-like [Cataglyphis hispanica]